VALVKYNIDKNIAANKHYLVAGNRIRLADVDTDAVAEKLFNANVKGVSLAEVAQPILEVAVEPVTEVVAKPAAPKKQ
jgi:hypothetical protein